MLSEASVNKLASGGAMKRSDISAVSAEGARTAVTRGYVAF